MSACSFTSKQRLFVTVSASLRKTRVCEKMSKLFRKSLDLTFGITTYKLWIIINMDFFHFEIIFVIGCKPVILETHVRSGSQPNLDSIGALWVWYAQKNFIVNKTRCLSHLPWEQQLSSKFSIQHAQIFLDFHKMLNLPTKNSLLLYLSE